MIQKLFILFLFPVFAFAGSNKDYYWQQAVNYSMVIDMNVETNQFTGVQKLTYINNSPDTLKKVFYHLYFNAFQPGSMMDVRSRTIIDPDRRVKDRISKLIPEEFGYQEIDKLTHNGKAVSFEMVGTILEVTLTDPILPGKKAQFDMEFNAQVPIQIRRSGRDNKEDIRYSMTQWYPKMCEYDFEGWHSNPYIGREFHGVIGEFDITINIDSSYMIAATGILSNKQEIGHGYEDKSKPVTRPEGNKLSWNFKANDVHDFAWAADPDYTHTMATTNNGIDIHFFYQTDTCKAYWEKLPKYAVECFQIMNSTFGEYQYNKYSIIQGGDGGMEYPMATLISGRISQAGLISVTVHEAIHSWYQHALATNESKYPWMDEGFTSYAQDYVLNEIYKKNSANPHLGAYKSYYRLVNSNKEEPLTTHADHYHTNFAYGVNSYSKGQVFLHQLHYVIGKEAFHKTMVSYYNTWKLKHPTPTDFKAIAERVSGLELDWYFEHFIGTTNHIDYGIKSVNCDAGITKITIERICDIPMPLDVVVKLKDGRINAFNIPMRIMRGAKSDKSFYENLEVLKDWPWVYPQYSFNVPFDIDEIEKIMIDPTGRMADINQADNVFPNQKTIIFDTQQ